MSAPAPDQFDQTIPEGKHPLLAGRYRVVRRLGAGGMGEVHLVEDLKLDDRLFAVKLLPSFLAANKRAIAGLKREALHAMELSHPNVVTVRGFEEMDSGQPFLVMDHVDGQSIEEILVDRDRMDESEVVRVFGPIGEALDYAHRRGVIHRDVKPSNIMIRDDGTPLIMDFGIAREAKETSTLLTGRESNSGTLPYMSPEQLRGRKPAAAQDIYSLAATMWECLSGEPPFSRGDLRHQILEEIPDMPRELEGLEISELLMKGLSKDPADRPKSCKAFFQFEASAAAPRPKTARGASPQPSDGSPRSAADLVDLESRVRILGREAKRVLEEGEPLPQAYMAKFERAGHFLESAKENKLGRLWSDAAAILERACGLYEEIQSARAPYDAFRRLRADILEIDKGLNADRVGLDLHELPRSQAYKTNRAELDRRLEKEVGALDWSSACQTAKAIIEPVSTHRKWVRSLRTAREEVIRFIADVDRIDGDLGSLESESDHDSDPKIVAYRSNRVELKDRLETEMTSQAWLEARATASDLHTQAEAQRSRLRQISDIRQRTETLREEIKECDARIAEIDLRVDLSEVAKTREFRSGRAKLDEDLSRQIGEGEWMEAEATLSTLRDLIESHVAWSEGVLTVHRKVMKVRAQIAHLDEELISCETETALGGRSRFEEFRAKRISLDARVKAQTQAGDWMGVLSTTRSVRGLVDKHCAWIRKTSKARQEYLGLRPEIDVIVADTRGLIKEIGSGGERNPALSDGMTRQSDLMDQVDLHVTALAWEEARAGAIELRKIALTNRKRWSQALEAHRRTVGNARHVAALRRRRVGRSVAFVTTLAAIGAFAFWWFMPLPVRSIAAGGDITVAVLSDGSLGPKGCWGFNYFGERKIPRGIGTPENPVLSVEPGRHHTVALLADGSVACWGYNDHGQCEVPEGIGTPGNPVASVVPGRYHTVAMLKDGSVACWGQNVDGQCDVPEGIGVGENTVASVAAGDDHTIAVLADGSVACWGRNTARQCDVPVDIGTPRNPVANVIAGAEHSVAVLADGSVVCWGDNEHGQCDVPTKVGTAKNPVASVTAGDDHTVALLMDGSLAAWGRDNSGQCTIPVEIGTPDRPVASVIAGGAHTIAVLADGSVSSWGGNNEGQCDLSRLKFELADVARLAAKTNLDDRRAALTKIVLDRRFEAAKIEAARLDAGHERITANIGRISAGGVHTVTVVEDGTIACWGGNQDGQCDVPEGIGSSDNAVMKVAAGGSHSVAVSADGSVTCWGGNNDGQCDVPIQVGTAKNPVASAAAGYFHTVALLADGSVVCWGFNGSGQCDVPEGVGTSENPVDRVAVGTRHTVALLADGSVVCWGNNLIGQCDVPSGIGTPENPVSNVAAGSSHTVAVLLDGSIVCWGYNGPGQCDVPDGIGTPENPVATVSAGDNHTVAVLANGSVACWGGNNYGQCDVPPGIGTPENPVASVAAGGDHTIALLSDGSVVGWGSNPSGQCTPPEGLRVRISTVARGDETEPGSSADPGRSSETANAGFESKVNVASAGDGS